MLASLSQPVVTDYVHAVKPPWLLLLLVGIVIYGLPRELLPAVLVSFATLVLIGALTSWAWKRYASGRSESFDDEDVLRQAA